MDSAKTARSMSAPLASASNRHPTRAYLASFGTAGSLLAGAAILFVLASAFVAFNGWPQVGDGSSPAAVVLNASSHSVSASRQLATALARVGAGPTAAASGATGRSASGVAGTGGATGGPGLTFFNRLGGSSHRARHTSGPVPQTPSAVPGSGNSLGAVVSSAGSHLGSTVTALTGRLANQVRPISPAASGVLRHAGNAAGRTIQKTGAAVGGLLPGGN